MGVSAIWFYTCVLGVSFALYKSEVHGQPSYEISSVMASKFFDIPPDSNGITKTKCKLVAAKYLSIPVTSAPVEKLFSIAEYNCEGTFNPNDSSIFATYQANCAWKFETYPDETFLFTFLECGVGCESADCSKNHVNVRYKHLDIKHCGGRQTPYTIEVSSNVVTISKQSTFSFKATVIRVTKSHLKIYETPVTWTEAMGECKEKGGNLVESYPVVSEQLKALTHAKVKATDNLGDTKAPSVHNPMPNGKKGYWIGKSLTPWVILDGCVEWGEIADGFLAYKMSKYNQMSECASSCYGFVYFLLQKDSCHCISEFKERTRMYVPFIKCVMPCRGMPREKCGGWNVFTLYKYYQGETIPTDKVRNCVSKQGEPVQYNQISCEIKMGFSCKMKNGSVVTFNPNIPGRQESLTWQKALEFCTSLKDSLGMAPDPKYQRPYFEEAYWTTVIRAVDWNYDTLSYRIPEVSFLATLDAANSYVEYTRNSSEKHGFICQFVNISCGHEEVTDFGNITSLGYPELYHEHQTCEWNITVNDTKVIKLLVLDLDMEDSLGCIYDYLLVKENRIPLEKLCGRQQMKYIFTQNNTVTLVFRSDYTVSGRGFSVQWSAVEPRSHPRKPTNEIATLSGGAVAGITVAITTFLVALAFFIVSVVYKKRRTRQRQMQDGDDTSTAHNAAYAISSFESSNFGEEDTRSYQHVSKTNSKKILRNAISYANDPKYQIESSANVYNTINYENGRSVPCENIDGSKANLLLDSDSSTFGSINLETHGDRKKPVTDDLVIGGACGKGRPSIIDISIIDDLGKDCIEIVSVENIEHEEKAEKVTRGVNTDNEAEYTEIESNLSYKPDEDEYLNERLDKNTHTPHYEDVSESVEDTHGYIRKEQIQANKEKNNRESHTYLEL